MKPAIHRSLDAMIDPAHTAFLVIDLQRDFCRDEPRKAIIPGVERLLQAARDAGALVVYIQNTVLPDGLSDAPSDLARRQGLGIDTAVTIEGTEGQRFVEGIEPLDGDPVIRKHRLNGFTNTTLDTILRSSGIETIVCVGSATHGCIINTAYGAIALNYYVVVAEDCVASWRQDLHDAAIFLMRNTINHVTDSATLIETWARAASAAPAAPATARA